MKRKLLTLALILALIIAASATFLASLAEANPVPPELIAVGSPQDNKTYSSTELELNFTQLPDTGWNFTSFHYSLDGKTKVATNGSAVLTGLSYGSHTLTIYGTGTYTNDNRTSGPYEQILEERYFSIVFSTGWTVLSIVLVAATCAGLLLRKKLVNAFSGKKTITSWFGAVWLLFSAALTSFTTWAIINKYLYPHYPPDLDFSLAGNLVYIALGICSILIGLCIMKAGAKKNQIPQKNN